MGTQTRSWSRNTTPLKALREFCALLAVKQRGISNRLFPFLSRSKQKQQKHPWSEAVARNKPQGIGAKVLLAKVPTILHKQTNKAKQTKNWDF